MQKNVVVSGRTLTQSGATPSTVTFTLTPVDVPAMRITGQNSPVLLQEIQITCVCGGTVDAAGNLTYVGDGSGSIVASTPHVSGEGQDVLLEGDNVTINCSGTSTNTSSGVTTDGVPASVTVTISSAGQTRVTANDS